MVEHERVPKGPFWPRIGPWHLEKFRAEKTEKRDFPELGEFLGGKTATQKFLPKTAQLFYILCFD